MATSTRRLSGGKHEGISRGSSTIAGVGGGTGASTQPLAQEKLSRQGIKVQSKPTRTFLEQKVSRAPEATYIPTPAALPKPNKDLQTLADTYGDIESGLRGATTAFLDREEILNEEAKKEADKVAAKYAISGGSALEPLDKVRDQHELASRNEELSTEERAYHLKQYNTLRNIDPRVNDYLGDALQYQAGLKLVSGMYTWSQNLQTEDGKALVLNPHEGGEDGQPNQLDQQINDYLGQITSPTALDRLSGQIANQRVAIYSYHSEKYAQQQDVKHTIAFKTSLTEGVLNAGQDRDDGINGDGSYLSGILTEHKQRGASLKSQEEVKKNLLESLINEAIAASTVDGKIDHAKLTTLTKLIEDELDNARTGPQDQVETIFHPEGEIEVIDKRPYLKTETVYGSNLGGTFSEELDKKINQLDDAEIKTAKKEARKDIQNQLNEKEKEWRDKDLTKEGNQTFPTKVGNQEIDLQYDLVSAYQWISQKRDEIANSGESYYIRQAKTQVLDSFENELKDRALSRNTRFDVYQTIEDTITTNSRPPILVLADINRAERIGLLDSSQAADLKSLAKDRLSISDQNINQVIQSQEDALFKKFTTLAKTGNLGTGKGFEADQSWSAAELTRYQLLMNSTQLEVAKVLNNKELSEQEKINQVNQLYTSLDEKITRMKGNPALFDVEVKRDTPAKAENIFNKGKENQTISPALSNNKEASAIIKGENSRTTDTGIIEIKTASGEWIPKDQVFIEAALTKKENQTLDTYKTNALTLNRRITILENARDYEGKQNDINELKETLQIVNNHILKQTNKAQEQGYVPLAQKDTYQNGYTNPTIGTNGLPYKQNLAPVGGIEISATDRKNILLVSTGEFYERYAGHSGAEGVVRARPVPYSYMIKRREELAYQVATGGKFVWIKHKGRDRLTVVGGEDMRTLPTTSDQRSDYYNDNPNQVVKNMWKGRDLKQKDRANTALNVEVLYETNVFQDQLLAIMNGSAFVPYDNAVNKICEKLGITPFKYLSKQYEAHYGEPMPTDLQTKIIDGLNTKGHKFNRKPKLYREGLGYPVTEPITATKTDTEEISSRTDDPGVLIASGTGLEPGMIPGPPPRIDPGENKKLYPEGIETGNYILPTDVSNDKEFVAEVEKLSNDLDIPVNYLWAVMGFETGGTYDPGQYNLGPDRTKESGSGAVGLIQFTPETLKEWGVTTEQAAKMTRLEQMKLVKKHLTRYIKPGDDFRDVYMSILFPAALGKPNDFVLFGKGAMKGYTDTAYEQNKGLDKNGDGSVTKEEAASSIPQYLLSSPVLKKKESSTISGGSDIA